MNASRSICWYLTVKSRGNLPHHMLKFGDFATISGLIFDSPSHVWRTVMFSVCFLSCETNFIYFLIDMLWSENHGVSQIMLQYIKLCSALSILHIFYEMLHTRIRQRLIMTTLFKRNRSIRFVVYFTHHNFCLAYFGCTDMFLQIDSVNTNSLDYLGITHTVYQHQQLKWVCSIWDRWSLYPRYSINSI